LEYANNSAKKVQKDRFNYLYRCSEQPLGVHSDKVAHYSSIKAGPFLHLVFALFYFAGNCGARRSPK